MQRKCIIISENLKELNKGENVRVVPKNSKIIGTTVKELYGMTVDEIAVIKIDNEDKDDNLKEKDIEIYIINKNDIKFI